jgi:hypothetical protein
VIKVVLSGCPETAAFCSNVNTPQINTYWYGNDSPASGSYTLDISPRTFGQTSLTKGDKILIVQMQSGEYYDTDFFLYGVLKGSSNAGVYEFTNVASFDGRTLQVFPALTNSYYTTLPSSTDFIEVYQVVRVPVCTSNMFLITDLQCAPWDGKTGGIIGLFANNLYMNGHSINCAGKGFPGGQGSQQDTDVNQSNYVSDNPQLCASKGSGYCGAPDSYVSGGQCRGATCSAGGGGNNINAGGGGGGSCGSGGIAGVGYFFAPAGGGGSGFDFFSLPTRMILGLFLFNFSHGR